MLCDICHTREARIFYTEIINGQKREQHLCEECAGEQTLAIKDRLGNEIPIGSILSGILQNYAKGIASKQANEPVCMRCGMTASELVKGGRVGCPECYNAFSMIIDKNLKAIQGAVEHHGKVPANADRIMIRPAAAAADSNIAAVRPPKERRGAGTVVKPSKPVKTPAKTPAPVPEIERLKAEQAHAVEEEDYELAAHLRDRIHELENLAKESASKESVQRKASPATKEPVRRKSSAASKDTTQRKSRTAVKRSPDGPEAQHNDTKGSADEH